VTGVSFLDRTLTVFFPARHEVVGTDRHHRPPLSNGAVVVKPRLAPVAGVVLLVLVLAVGCGGRVVDAQADEPVEVVALAGPRTIAVIGDSISEQSKPSLERYGAAHDLTLDVDATSGYMTREKQDAAEQAAATHPAAAVIALGTNDAVCRLTNALVSGSCRYPGFAIADMEADLTTMAATLDQPGTCVVGVNAYFGEEVGDHLEALVADGRLDGVVDWRTVATTDATVLADGIGHLTPDGQDRFAQVVVDETARICAL
jgi:hypothetical protein